MYHSTHAYQSTESIENHWKDFRFQSKNGIKYILKPSSNRPPYIFTLVIPTIFLESVWDIAIASVRPSRYPLLNHWTKSNQIWCVSCSHKWGVQRHIFFSGEGPRGQISLNFNYKVNF